MRLYQADNANSLYKKLLVDIIANGRIVNPRGQTTRDLGTVVSIINRPRQRLLSCFSRVLNPFMLTAEIVWICAGRGDIKFITYFCKDLDKFSDSGFNNFNGAYGQRIRRYGINRAGHTCIKFWDVHGGENGFREFDQLRDIIKKLKKDKDTRQAVITLHNPIFDRAEVDTQDRPCNITSMIKIIDNKLQWHQVVRSNDCNLGLYNANIYQWSFIQEYVASCLGIDVGELLFFSDSLHLYESDPITKRVLNDDRNIDIYNFIKPVKMPFNSLSMNDFIINEIINNIEDYKTGNNITNYDNDFWQTINLMLEIYIDRKEGNKLEAIRKTSLIPADDFRIMAFNYHYNKAKTNEEREEIKKHIVDFAEPVQKFITEKS